MDKVDSIIIKIKKQFPDSSFNSIKDEWIASVEDKYPNFPKNLKKLYKELGYGTIGKGYYSIHVLLEPDEIYDAKTAQELEGKLIVGDDYGGICHAYDTENNWEFGYIDCNGEFNSLTKIYIDFIDFLENLL